MHEYGVDPSNRVKVYFYLATFSTLVMSLVKYFATELAPDFFGKDTIVIMSTAPLYLLVLSLFDAKLWDTKISRFIFGISTPNLSGDWEAELLTSHDKGNTSHKAKFTIKQTWQKISIKGVFEGSDSYSKLANFYIDNSAEKDILFSYISEPRALSVKTMEIHHGLVRADITDCGKTIKGEYFSGRGRSNHGSIIFKKVL